MAEILKPLLQEVVCEGWILPDSYAVNYDQFEALAAVSRCLNTRSMVTKNFPSEINLLIPFENHPILSPQGLSRSIANIRSIAKSLCTIHGCATVEELFSKAKEAPEIFSFNYEEKRNISKALRAMMEYLNVKANILMPEIFSHESSVFNFIAGDRLLSYERIIRIPNRIAQAYSEKHGGTVPEEIRWRSAEEWQVRGLSHEEAAHRSAQEFTEKGVKLAALDKNCLRAAIAHLLQEQHRPRRFMEALGGPTSNRVSAFLNNRQWNGNLGTFLIAKMGRELGVPDIFALNEMGKTLLEQERAGQEPDPSTHAPAGKFTRAESRRGSNAGINEGRT